MICVGCNSVCRADYGPLNRVARQSVNLDRITPQWDG